MTANWIKPALLGLWLFGAMLGGRTVQAAELTSHTVALNIESLAPANEEGIPAGVMRLTYRSRADGQSDWALLRPPANPNAVWVVHGHGHGSHGDQFFTRADLGPWRDHITSRGLGLLAPDLRGSTWMNESTVDDLHELLAWVRATYGAKQFVLLGGSMGATGWLIYTVCHPEDVAGVVALCPATDLARYHAWCGAQSLPVVLQIRTTIEEHYDGSPSVQGERYRLHSALEHAEKLTMPLYLVHGTADAIIPVSMGRALTGALQRAPQFVYREIPDGDHDAPLAEGPAGLTWVLDKLKPNKR